MTKNDLVKRYDINAPRYTSYPPVPFWKGAPDLESWVEDIKSSYDETQGVDIYIHVPFCKTICHYCGCNRELLKCSSQEELFVAALLKEWDFYTQNIKNIKVGSIHFGGGTPSALSPSSLAKILDTFAPHKLPDFIGSIELHPSITTREQLETLKNYNIDRVSIGVQDLNNQVLDAVNRNTDINSIVSCYQQLRELSFSSINFDLIYGLPHQTIESITKTFKQVVELSPDMIAYYSFAYVPWKMENQKLIDDSKIPDGELKKELFDIGTNLLMQNNYVQIGLDHFAKADNFLGKAALGKTLHRNFMGYTDKKSNILIGLGPSAISNTPKSFAQNQKNLNSYINQQNDGSKFCNGHQLSPEDICAQQIIMDLMCNGICQIDLENLAKDQKTALQTMEQDGILILKDSKIEITTLGAPFSRNVAALFDHHFDSSQVGKNQFSRTV